MPHVETLDLSQLGKAHALPADVEQHMTECGKCSAPVCMVTVRMKSVHGVVDRIRFLDLVGPHGLTISGRDSTGTNRNWVRRHWCRNQ